MKKLILILLLVIISACSQKKDEQKQIVVDEVFQTARDTMDNVDSPTFWKGKNDENWIISTAKYTDVLIVDDAETGKNIKRVGGEGTELGKLDRPNGIFVIDDMAIVVERDNHRVQLFTLPDFISLGSIGDSLLIKPYGLFVYRISDGYRMYVTDNYETEDEQIPPDNELNRRVHIYTFNVNDSLLSWELQKTFGDTTGLGRLQVVESIYGDVENNKILISEEDVTQSSLKVYDLDGNFTGQVFGKGKFDGQVEGLTLYKCDSTKGYWIVTNQSYDNNQFLVFDRNTFNLAGTFTGPKTTNTDGIWLTQTPYGKFTKGAFFAVNNDGNVSVFDWADILRKLKLNCKY